MIRLPKVILASASPRRAEILRTAGWPFAAFPVDIDESRHPAEDAVSYVERLAREKAAAAAARCDGSLIVAADTTVTIDQHILEKPAGGEDAARMLQLLNNRWHKVLTGLAVFDRKKSQITIAHEATEVKFAALSDEEIQWYLATGEPMDKAGGYAIQGLGARLIEEIRGDYFNVVGLPLRLLYEMVQANAGRQSLEYGGPTGSVDSA